jgi:chaperonin GroES
MAKTRKIRPLGDRVIVEAMSQETSKSGIIIPDTANKEKPQQGTVIAVGPGRLSESGDRLAPEVKEGDVVLFGKYSGTEIEVDSNELLILRESDILAVL